MFRKPTFSEPPVFSYDDAKGRTISVKKSDDNRLLGFFKNPKKTKLLHEFSLVLDGGDDLPDGIARFIDPHTTGIDLSGQSKWFRFLTFVIGRKVTKAEIIYDAEKTYANNSVYRAGRTSTCFICDVAGWRKPSVMFLYIHNSSTRYSSKVAGGNSSMDFKHFFFPSSKLSGLQKVISDHTRQ